MKEGCSVSEYHRYHLYKYKPSVVTVGFTLSTIFIQKEKDIKVIDTILRERISASPDLEESNNENINCYRDYKWNQTMKISNIT